MYLGHPRLLALNFAACYRFCRDVMGFQVSRVGVAERLDRQLAVRL
jgi:hypothetical protein